MDRKLLLAAARSGKTAAQIKRISVGMRQHKQISGERIVVLCDLLDTVAALLDELSIAAQLDAEEDARQ